MLATSVLAVGLSLFGVANAIPLSSELSSAKLLPRADQGSLSRCVVESNGDPKMDDVPAIERAFKDCGVGGTIVFQKGVTYYIWSLL